MLNTRSNQPFASTVKKVDTKGLNVDTLRKLERNGKEKKTNRNLKEQLQSKKIKLYPSKPPNKEIVYETEYPQLGKQNKRAGEEVSPTDYITNCCKIKLNSKRKSDLREKVLQV